MNLQIYLIKIFRYLINIQNLHRYYVSTQIEYDTIYDTLGYSRILYSETLNNEYIERINQMTYSSLSDKWNVADI